MAAHDNLARKISIIPVNAPEDAKVRVAAYCRVSSDSDDQLNSFAAQNTYYTTLFSTKENWIMVDIYADEGITGTSAEIREDFQRLMNDCRKGRIDKIYTKSISRFARNTKDCLEATRALKAMGIGVVFEEQHIDTSIVSGEMLTAVFAACAQAESESISKNIRWSYQKKMQAGTFIPPYLPYGYDCIDGVIRKNLEQAPVVERIFMEYLSGRNTDEIACGLRRDGIPGKSGEIAWDSTSIRYILTNEKYTGDSVWQKYYTPEELPHRTVPNRGAVDAYYASGTHEKIINAEVFERANKLLRERSMNITRQYEVRRPLRGKIICGCCRTVFRQKNSRGRVYWACLSRDKKRNENCETRKILETEIATAFCRFYYKLKNHGMKILTEMVENLENVRERQMLWSPDVIEINKRISSITTQRHKLTLLNRQGAVDSDIFISKSNQLAEQLRKAKREKEKLLQQRGDDTLRKTREMIDILDCGPDFLDCFDEELFRELIDKIIVESNERIRFRLKNGLELPEYIERPVR